METTEQMVPGPDETASLGPVFSTSEEAPVAILAVISGGAPPVAVRIERPVTVGRGSECDVVVADSSASRMHVRFWPGPNGVTIEDLGSRNGTLLDGRRVSQATVREAALVRIGQTLMCIRFSGEPWQFATATGPLVGGHALALVRRQIRLVGPTALPALVRGETGTGKDVAARMLHEASGRPGPFIAVNCATLPENLVESELFGHARGAFTGANHARRGLFVAADGGTLFLDEIGELPLPAQAKLLRVLEDGLVRPVGAEKSQAVDVRVLSATNRDLIEEVESKRFRADLLARLGGVEIHMPPLRDRPEDLPALAEFLLARGRHAPVAIEADALEAMMLYEWTMNVREFESVLRTAMLEAGSSAIALDSLPERVRAPYQDRRNAIAVSPAPTETAAPSRRSTLERALLDHGGNVRRASQALGLSRSHLYRLLMRYGIEPQAFRKGGTARAEHGATQGSPE